MCVLFIHFVNWSVSFMYVTQVRMDESGDDRQVIWFDSLIHGREWLAGATLMNVVNRVKRRKIVCILVCIFTIRKQ